MRDPGLGKAGEREGVLLLQVGGADTLRDVRPFLRSMLSDPAVVALPGPLRVPLAWLVSVFRAPRARRWYRRIGGGSPIRAVTDAQAAGLRRELESRGRPMPVFFGMRHSRPAIEDALAEAARHGLSRLVVLPLFPQFSTTTTGSAFLAVRSLLPVAAPRIEAMWIEDYPDHPGYVAALVETVEEALDQLPEGSAAGCRLIFSAHGIPSRYVEAGDPYPERVAATVASAMKLLEGRVASHEVAFQSRLGPVEWLGPDTRECLASAARDGVDTVVLVPVSFVSEHLETLYEMDVIYRDEARSLGITRFARARALNDSRVFLGALADLALSALGD